MKLTSIFPALLIIFVATSCNTSSHLIPPRTNLKKDNFESSSFDLPKSLDEISGLQLDEDDFYGFNDSGGKAELYKINSKGKIIQTIRLKNAENKDWESITANDSIFFLADVGNNRGNRKDLCIYYIYKKDISPDKSIEEVYAQKISFYYPEQKNYQKQTHKHDFDCEAISWFNGKLHLFTKEWKSNKTHHYTLEVTKKRQAAKLIGLYDTKFLVTGADILKIDETSSLLALIGYTRLGGIHLIKSIIPNNQDNLLNFPKEATRLGRAGKLGQVEGVAIKSPKILYYSAEAYKGVPQHITKIKLK